MPYKQGYSTKTVGTGGSKTPMSVMGSQGAPASIKPSFNKSKSVGHKPFPESKRQSKRAY